MKLIYSWEMAKWLTAKSSELVSTVQLPPWAFEMDLNKTYWATVLRKVPWIETTRKPNYQKKIEDEVTLIYQSTQQEKVNRKDNFITKY